MKRTKPLPKSKRRAILLKVATHIERHPELYQFLGGAGSLSAKDPMCPLRYMAYTR